MYPCGHCTNCLHSRQSKWRRKLDFELNTSGVYALFITLTYSNDHLPLLEYDESNNFVKFTRTKFDSHGNYERIDETDKFRERFPDFESHFDGSTWHFPHFTAFRSRDHIIPDSSNNLAISYLPDIQDFIKRLRTNLSRCRDLQTEDTSFKYFICSEYGPESYRPHYHGILFFRSQRVCQHAHGEFIVKSWNKCKNDFNQTAKTSKFITKNDGVSSYVSKYVTCDTSLPSCFTAPFTRPFYTFSKSSPIGSEFISLLDAKEFVEKRDLLYHTKFYDKEQSSFIPIDYPYTDSIWNRIFPRFAFEGRLPSEFLFKVYKYLYYIARYQFKPTDPFGSIPDRFEYDIPNYIDEVKERFFVNYNDFKSDLNGSSFNSFGRFFGSLVCEPDSLGLFAFGIPQNRSAAIKIIRNFRTGIFSDPFDYYSFSVRFNFLKFNDQYSQLVDYSNIYAPDGFTPPLVAFIYNSFYESLPKHRDALSEYQRVKYDRILTYGFNLSIEDFYIDGQLIAPYSDSFVFDVYSDYVNHTRRKHKSSRKYNFNKHLDL